MYQNTTLCDEQCAATSKENHDKLEEKFNLNQVLEKISTKLNVSIEYLLENSNVRKKIFEIKKMISSREKFKAKTEERVKEIVKKLSREIEYTRNIIERRVEIDVLRWTPKPRLVLAFGETHYPIVSFTELIKGKPLNDQPLPTLLTVTANNVNDEESPQTIIEILNAIEPEQVKKEIIVTKLRETFEENELYGNELLQVPSKSLFFFEDDLMPDLLVTDTQHIEFNNFENGKVYDKSIMFKNRSNLRLFCKFIGIQANGLSKITCIDVNPKMNIKFFPAGVNKFDLKFTPQNIHKDIVCDLIFLVVDESSARSRTIIHLVACLPKLRVTFSSFTVTIQPTAIWNFDKGMVLDKYGTLFITNPSSVPVIVRIFNAKFGRHQNVKSVVQELQDSIEVIDKSVSNKVASRKSAVPSITSKVTTESRPSTKRGKLHKRSGPSTQTLNSHVDTAEAMRQDILENCLQAVFEPFHVDWTYAVLPPGKKCTVKFYFINAMALGYHQERYNIELWDNVDENLIRVERVDVLSETFDLPLRIEPNTVDMRDATVKQGICIASFTIYNDIKAAPALVSLCSNQPKPGVIRFDPKTVSIPAQSSVMFTISYFVKSLSVDFEEDAVLHFVITINVKVGIQKYSGAPPLFVQVYAPYNLNKVHFPNVQEIIIK